MLTALAHFTGTTQWYRNRMFPAYTYTDGVKFLAEEAECYWLIDYVFSNQLVPEIRGHDLSLSEKRRDLKKMHRECRLSVPLVSFYLR